jgi:TPR repeat protein
LLSAAFGGLKEAIYSLAVIVFNGSGGTRESRDIGAAVALCARAASLGHVDALRELGFCIHDGYGVARSVPDGRRLIVLAKAREMAEAATGSASLSGFTPLRKQDVASRFMVEWAERRRAENQEGADRDAPTEGGPSDVQLRMCANKLCGREETRWREFRRCSFCASVHYCSRACQARDWIQSHKANCAQEQAL